MLTGLMLNTNANANATKEKNKCDGVDNPITFIFFYYTLDTFHLF